MPIRYLFFPAIFGFISGLPLMLVGSTLQAWGTTAGLNLMTLGLLTLIGMPYVYKFLWAPLLDRYSIPFLRGHRRSWILVTIFCLALSLFALSQSQLPQQLTWFMGWSFAAAFFSASLDISIDAYRTELLPKEHYGLGNAVYVTAYRLSMLVSGGLALIIADYCGWKTTYHCMIGLLLLGLVIASFAPEPEYKTQHAQKFSWEKILLDPIRNLWQRKGIFVVLLFIVLYKFGEALGTALTSTFLLRELHFSLTAVGSVYKTVSIVATISGAFLGGYYYRKLNLYQTLLWFGALQCVSMLFYVLLAMVGKNLSLMIIAVGAEAFFVGMTTTVFLSFLMRLCHSSYTGTHYALLSAFASIGRIFTGPLASELVKHYSWAGYFFISFLLSIPGLIILRYLKASILAPAEDGKGLWP